MIYEKENPSLDSAFINWFNKQYPELNYSNNVILINQMESAWLASREAIVKRIIDHLIPKHT